MELTEAGIVFPIKGEGTYFVLWNQFKEILWKDINNRVRSVPFSTLALEEITKRPLCISTSNDMYVYLSFSGEYTFSNTFNLPDPRGEQHTDEFICCPHEDELQRKYGGIPS